MAKFDFNPVKGIKQLIRKVTQGFTFKTPKVRNQPPIEQPKKETSERAYKKPVFDGKATQQKFVKSTLGREVERKPQSQPRKKIKQIAEAILGRTRTGKESKETAQKSTSFTPPVNISGDSSFFEYMVINEYRRNIAHFGSMAYAELSAWLDNLIAEYGEHAVAEMLEKGASSGTVVTYEIAYDDSKLQNYMSDMFNYLEFGDDYRADISDALDEDSNFDVY